MVMEKSKIKFEKIVFQTCLINYTIAMLIFNLHVGFSGYGTLVLAIYDPPILIFSFFYSLMVRNAFSSLLEFQFSEKNRYAKFITIGFAIAVLEITLLLFLNFIEFKNPDPHVIYGFKNQYGHDPGHLNNFWEWMETSEHSWWPTMLWLFVLPFGPIQGAMVALWVRWSEWKN